MSASRGWVAGLLAIALAAGCATDAGRRASDTLELYEAHAGPEVDGFRLIGSLNGWTALGDRAVALWTRPGKAYLVGLQGPCPDILHASSISVTSQSGQVSARFDKVIPRGAGALGMPCVIDRIRPLDVRGLRAAQKAVRDQAGSGGT